MTETQNIIFLTVDALRADHVSCCGYGRDTTPNIDKLASKNINFTKAFSASSHTREAVPALLTGHYPDEAVNSDYMLATDTIAAELQRSGYTTGGFHSNPFVSRAYGFGKGFDRFDDDLYLGQNRLVALAQRAFDKLRNRHYARGDEINKRSLDWIDSIDDEPFFLWNHYMDPHGPYEPPNEYRKLFHDNPVSDSRSQQLYKKAVNSPDSISDAEHDQLIDLYDAEIRYLDDQIGEMLDSLRERDLLDNSLLILTADHGDLFGEYGYYEHPRYPYHELLHVPLIVRHPNQCDITYSDPVSTLDIAPTLFDEAGTAVSTPGVSLQSRWEKPDSCIDLHQFGQASTITDNGELLRRYSIHTTEKCEIFEYSIEGENSKKTRIFFDSDPELAELLEKHAVKRIEKVGSTNSSDTDETDDVSEEIEDRLDALGYLE